MDELISEVNIELDDDEYIYHYEINWEDHIVGIRFITNRGLILGG